MRLLLTYHLILSLLVGPMLCCCTAARVGHEGPTGETRSVAIPAPHRKHCCGQPKPDSGSPKSPVEKPTEPGKCPCKQGGEVKVAASETTVPSAASLQLLTAPVALFVSRHPVDAMVASFGANPQFDHRSSTPSASDILDAHHKLRC